MEPQAWPNTPGNSLNPDPHAFDPANPNKVDHAQIGSQDQKQGGKDMGLVKPPIVSMHLTSQAQGEANAKAGEHTVIDNANFRLGVDTSQDIQFKYPFEDLKPSQGMFIPVEENSTTDALMSKLFKQVAQYRKQASEVERDEDGDDVMEDVAINKKKRNDDGTVQLDGDTPRLGIKSGFRPKLLGPAFTVKAVVKGDQLSKNNKADSDGALVIRMS